MTFRLLALVAFGFIVAAALVDAQDGNGPSIKDVMGKLNKGPMSLCPSLGKALKADPPDWDDVQKDAKTFVSLVEALTRTEPPRGDKASWDTLTRAYLQSAKELDAATNRKDKPAALAAHGKLAQSANCNACHKPHRG